MYKFVVVIGPWFKNNNEVIENYEVAQATPSIVDLSSTEEILIGTMSKSNRQAVTNPTNTIFGTNRMSKRHFNYPQTWGCLGSDLWKAVFPKQATS